MSIGLMNVLASAEASANPIDKILSSGKVSDQVANPEYWSSVFSIVVVGIVVVFVILLLLVFFIWLMGKIIGAVSGKKKNDSANGAAKTENTPEKTSVVLAAAEEVSDTTDDDEILAVISAAIAAFSAEEGKNYRITGIKRSENKLRSARSAWSIAGISENMRRF